MFTARSTRIFGVLLVISWGMVGISHARMFTEFGPPTGPGLGGIAVPQVQTPVSTLSLNNDNANPSDNEVALITPFGAVGPIDIRFGVQLSGGTTEYFFSETVTNNTGIAWIGYQLELGFGVGDTFYRFDEKPFPLNISFPDFDTPERDPTPISSVFNTPSTHGHIDIQWSGGIVPPAGTVVFTFSIDTPDDWCGSDLYSNFTLRQTPEPIPAPPALILGALGLGTSLTLMRKRRDFE